MQLLFGINFRSKRIVFNSLYPTTTTTTTPGNRSTTVVEGGGDTSTTNSDDDRNAKIIALQKALADAKAQVEREKQNYINSLASQKKESGESIAKLQLEATDTER